MTPPTPCTSASFFCHVEGSAGASRWALLDWATAFFHQAVIRLNSLSPPSLPVSPHSWENSSLTQTWHVISLLQCLNHTNILEHFAATLLCCYFYYEGYWVFNTAFFAYKQTGFCINIYCVYIYILFILSIQCFFCLLFIYLSTLGLEGKDILIPCRSCTCTKLTMKLTLNCALTKRTKANFCLVIVYIFVIQNGKSKKKPKTGAVTEEVIRLC